jgi:hypothetical protein
MAQRTCICSVKLAASQSVYHFTHIASVTFTFVAGSAWHAMKKLSAFSAWSSTFHSFLYKDMFKCKLLRDKKGLQEQCEPGKGKQCGKATLAGPVFQDYREQIPNGMGQQTMDTWRKFGGGCGKIFSRHNGNLLLN